MSPRRDAALATLRRLGLEAAAVSGDAPPDERLGPLLDGPEGVALADALGEVAGEATARLLAERAAACTDRVLRKALRRALFRLGQRGVAVPAPELPPQSPAVGGPELEGFVSAFDGRGDRLIWLVRPQASGGLLLLAAEVNEPEGLRDVRLVEPSRKEMRAARERLQQDTGLRLVAVDWRVLDALVVEAHQRAGAPDRQRDYLRLRPRLVSAPPQAPQELRSVLARPPTDDERPGLLADPADLLALPELRTWWPRPEAAAPFVEEIAAVRDSPLVLGRMQQEERLAEVLDRAAAALFPSAVIARRLEGTAYVLAETGRVPAARQALAAAQALRAGAGPADVPLLRALVQQGIGTILASEESRRQEQRRGSLVLTPTEALRDPRSSRPGRTRA
jgi:hypothetical protein